MFVVGGKSGVGLIIILEEITLLNDSLISLEHFWILFIDGS